MAISRIGPFALEAPLAPPTKAGQIFRGIHVEQRKLAALRIFPLPLGMTPESRQAYAEQVDDLKQLRHPGIVRCYGGGFDRRRAFLAYELVEGSSLDELLNRRGRLPWETASDYAKQIADALQYALNFSWSHGRLQPSKIMIDEASHIKILDWRREEISAVLNSPITIEQIQMSAPEILEGGAPNEKSDLYSLGCLMHLMMTGEPPFSAPGREELIEKIRTQDPPSVTATVFDCPVWLNAVVDQLLAKSPQKRPYSITAFLLAMREAERRESEGVGVLQHAASGFSPLQMNVDRKEVEKVLGIKPVKEKRASESSFWESPWVLLLGLVLAISGVVWFLMPPSEATLYRRAEKLLASEKWTDWNAARDGQLAVLLERFPESQYREWAEDKISWVDAREAERRMERDERLGRKDDWTQAQIQYAEARKFERFGDYLTALEKFRAIQTLFSDQEEAQPIVFLAAEGIQRIRETRDRDSLQELLERKMEEADQAYDRAQMTVAKMTWEAIVELYSGNQQVTPIVEQAKSRLAELNALR
jgi:eukaryotic-like serine/threonine-protein kinase